MKRLTPDSPELKSADLVAENIERLRELFPEAFANEGKIDFDALRQLLGDRVDAGEERYGLNWHGKRAARQLALTPSTGTLRPCPKESVDWDTTQNIFIEGDNLEVLKLLQKSYAGKVKLIYIDPPYNTGKDFVYPDNFQDSIKNYLEITGQVEGGQRITSNTEASGRFHTDWLNMMYPRLKAAHGLLRSDGAMFISIDDNEVFALKLLCDSIFGEECFAGCVSRVTGTPTGGGFQTLVNELDYVLVYLREPDTEISGVAFSDEDAAIYDKEDANGKYLIRPLRRTGGEDRRIDRPSMYFALEAPDGSKIYPIAPAGYESRWICGESRYREMLSEGLIEWLKVEKDGKAVWQVYQKFYLEGRLKQPSNLWDSLEGNKKASRDLKALFDGEKIFTFPKPVGLLRHVLEIAAADPDSIVCDFFAGSGTTAHAVMAHNRDTGKKCRYVLVQMPEPLHSSNRDHEAGVKWCETHGLSPTIASLTKERLRRAGRGFKEGGGSAQVDLGFRVFKLESSNVRPWEASRDTLAESLASAVDHVKPDRTEDDLLYDIILKHGLDLCAPIEEKQIGSHKVRSVGGGAVFTCLGSRITASDVEKLADGIAKWRDELAPANPELSRVVFRDSAFESDVAKTNLALILKERGFDEKLVVSL